MISLISASALIASESPVDPIYFGYGQADDGNNSLCYPY